MIFTMASSVDKINRNVNNPQFNTITIMIYGKVQRLIGVHVIWNYNAIMRAPNFHCVLTGVENSYYNSPP